MRALVAAVLLVVAIVSYAAILLRGVDAASKVITPAWSVDLAGAEAATFYSARTDTAGDLLLAKVASGTPSARWRLTDDAPTREGEHRALVVVLVSPTPAVSPLLMINGAAARPALRDVAVRLPELDQPVNALLWPLGAARSDRRVDLRLSCAPGCVVSRVGLIGWRSTASPARPSARTLALGIVIACVVVALGIALGAAVLRAITSGAAPVQVA